MIPVYTDFHVPHTYNSGERGIEGEVRAINGQLQVYNGSVWQTITATTLMNDAGLEELVEWARKKMAQELEDQQLAEQFPAFAKAKENYDMIRRLVENEVA
jgi:hypothetical protein